MIRVGYDASGAEMFCRCRMIAHQKVLFNEIRWRFAMRNDEAFEDEPRNNCGGCEIPVAYRLAPTTRSRMGQKCRSQL
jgi:hypothetical protein